jgi:hypothetical protein
MIGGNPVTFLRANNSALPHVQPLNSVYLHSREHFISSFDLCIIQDIIDNAGTCFEYGELCWKGRHASAGG